MADDEAFLYGEGDESQDGGQEGTEAPTADYEDESNSNLLPPAGQEEEEEDVAAEEEMNAPEESAELEDEDDDEEDDSDDDDVKITIDRDKIDEAKTSYQTFGLNKAVRQPPSEKKGKFNVEEFDQVGTINGTEAQEFDFDSMEEKPWRKPGADITDYFNYGFTEDTWQAYCNRQRKMRVSESGAGMPGMLNTINSIKPSGIGGSIPTVGVPPKRLPTIMHRSMPPPGIMSDASPSQASSLVPAPIAVMTSDKREFSKKIIETMDFSVPPPGIPPPGMPPTSVPPPTFDGPPPNPMGDFPADDPFGQDYDYYPAYEPTMESQWAAPPSALSGPPPGDAPPGDPTYDERHGERDVWRNERSGNGGGAGVGASGGRRSSRDERGDRPDRYEQRDRDRKRRRSRSRSRERYREYRERDRDRERERDRAVEVKRERRSDRRERSKSRSPKSRSPSHSSSTSRHKKSKKVKREKSEKPDKPEREIKQEKEDE